MPQLDAMSWTPDLELPNDISGDEGGVDENEFQRCCKSPVRSLFAGLPSDQHSNAVGDQPYARRKEVELNAERAQARLENEILKG